MCKDVGMYVYEQLGSYVSTYLGIWACGDVRFVGVFVCFSVMKGTVI